MGYQGRASKPGANTGTNTVGRITVETATDAAKDAVPASGHNREDFFGDLKKVAKKLPPDHPSRSDSQKR
jgi:hypothetical protein